MRRDISDWLNRHRRQWPEWAGWLILIGYLAVLYLMASFFWHVVRVFLFMGIFMALSLLVTIVFKFLGRGGK